MIMVPQHSHKTTIFFIFPHHETVFFFSDNRNTVCESVCTCVYFYKKVVNLYISAQVGHICIDLINSGKKAGQLI